MKKVIIGLLVMVVVIIVGLYSCWIYLRDNYRVGGSFSFPGRGTVVIREMKIFDTMDECIVEAKRVAAATPGMVRTKEIKHTDRTYSLLSEMADVQQWYLQQCMSSSSDKVRYILVVKAPGK